MASPLDFAARLTIDLDPWQERVLASQASQLLLNVTRQGGKSTISSLLGIAAALAKPDQLILIVSPGERQSKLLFKKLMRFYYQLGRPVLPRTENKMSLELYNGSEVHALPGDEGTIRGFSGVDLLLIDEASRVSDEMMAAVRPMLATSHGRLVAMSTPWGKRGWWWEAWDAGGDDWERYEVPVYACPRIPAEFIEREKRALPPLWFQSEYECQFVDPETALFSSAQLDRAFAPSGIEPLFPVAIEEAPEALVW